MKLQRLLFVAVPAGLGLAWWAASWAASGDSPSPPRLETTNAWAPSVGVQPKGFQPVVQVVAQVPLNGTPDPSLALPIGPDLTPGQESFLAPPAALAPPTPGPVEPLGPLAVVPGQPPAAVSGPAADDRLQFTVIDVPSAGPAGNGVVRLPPLPDELPSGNSGAHRLPPLLDESSPTAPPAPEMVARSAQSPQTHAAPIEAANVELSAGSAPVSSSSTDRSHFPETGPALGLGPDPAVSAVATTPAVSRATAPAAAAAEKPDPAGPEYPAPSIAAQTSGPPASAQAPPAVANSASPAAGAAATSLPRASQPNRDAPAADSPAADLRPLAELLRDAGAPAVASRATLPSSPKVAESAPASSPVTGSSAGASVSPPWATTPSNSATFSSATSSATNAAPPAAAASVASLSPALRQEKRPFSTAAVSPPAQPSDPAAQRAMHAVLLKADAHMQRGIALADRRAFYSARTEFLAALRLLVQGLDAQDGGTARSEALARGIWALDEANDFIPRGTAMNADLQIDRLVAAHRTTVLKSSLKPSESSAMHVTPLQAVQKYYTYAQEQLAAAVQPSREGSQLLTALGKLYVEMNQEPAKLAADAKTKGLVCQQAALLADPNNARAANELGVLLAREGRFEEARDWLRHSARLKPQPETWHNLATVHAGLGETQLAAAASEQSIVLARRLGQGTGGPQVQVKQVSPAAFAAQAGPGTQTPAAPAPTAPQTAAKTKNSGLWSWLPWR